MRRRNSAYLVWDADNREYKSFSRHSALRAIPFGQRNPIARWRIAVATVIQPLVVFTAALFFWGVINTPFNRPWAFEALILVFPFAASLIILLLSAILLGMLGAYAGLWRREDERTSGRSVE